MQKLFLFSSAIPIVLTLFISLIVIPSVLQQFNENGVKVEFISSSVNYTMDDSFLCLDSLSSESFLWPTQGYNTITSKFGHRVQPTTGAATYHGGIDIGAPQGAQIKSIADGIVVSAGWAGANGYCITIEHADGYKSTYGHVSPNLIVKKGDKIDKGQTIAFVGPKYVEEKTYTTYKDSTGKATNGATTGPHLHFAISKDGKKIDPQSMY